MIDRISILVAAVALAASAFAGEMKIGTQAVSLFADSEISTNVAFNVHRTDTKLLDVRIDAAMATDALVSVAFGRDANADGDLASEETEFVLGMSGDNCFIEDVAHGKRYYDWVTARTGAESYLEFSASNDRCFNPRSVTITCEKGALFSSIGAQPWMFSRSWNIMKITRRGTKLVNEICKVESRYRAMMLLLR